MLSILFQVALAVLGLALIGASATLNVAHALHQPLAPIEVAVWAGVAVVVSIGAALLPSAAFRAIDRRGLTALPSALLCLAGGLACIAFSTLNALSSAQSARAITSLAAGDAQSAREATRAGIEATRASIEAKAAELRGMGVVRHTTQIEADIARLLASRKDLADCIGYRPAAAAREVCDEVAGARAELATAKRRQALEAEIAALREKAAWAPVAATGHKVAVGNVEARAVVDYAAAIGITTSEAAVERLIVLLKVVVVEFGGAVCFIGAGALARRRDDSGKVAVAPPVSPPPPPPPVREPKARPARKPRTRVLPTGNVLPFDAAPAEFVARHVRDGGPDTWTTTSDLWEAYRVWCKSHSVGPVPRVTFGRALGSAGHARRKSGGAIWWRVTVAGETGTAAMGH